MGTPGVGGQPKGLVRRDTAETKAYAFKHARRAIDQLVQIVEDRSYPPGDRVSAGREILDRAVGKPQASVAVTQELGGTFLEALRIVHEQQAIENKGKDQPPTIDVVPSTDSDS